MKKRKNTRLLAVFAGTAALGLVGLGGCRLFSRGRPEFDPAYLASTEAAMWKAYYGRHKLTLAWLLVKTLHREFGISYWQAGQVGRRLANSAMKFKTARPGGYDVAMPDLIAAYTRIRRYSNLKFDPREAARAELAWWVARRTPGRNDPETVGRGIGRLYEIIYGYHHPKFIEAGLLRAQAAHVRDQGGKNCDWKKVKALLLQSYRALRIAIEAKPAPLPLPPAAGAPQVPAAGSSGTRA